MCPDPDSISPCNCQIGTLQLNVTMTLDCVSKNLTDEEIVTVVDAFIRQSKVNIQHNVLVDLNLSGNRLTHIPDIILLLLQSSLIRLNLTGNRINSFTNLVKINLNRQTAIILQKNNLTRLESKVFKSILQQMTETTAYIAGVPWLGPSLDISKSKLYTNQFKITLIICCLYFVEDPIDCSIDPCHLAWIFRDNKDLLKAIKNGECSNGTLFELLDGVNAFNNCPVRHFYG